MNVTVTEYDRKELETLTPDQYKAIQQVAIIRDTDLEAEDHLEALGILLPAEGCLPESFIGDDLCRSIREKFATIVFPAMELAMEELKQHLKHPKVHWFLVIDADYEDATHTAVIDAGDEPHCYFHEYEKAWNVGYESLAAIANEVLRIKAALVARYKKIHRLK